MRFIIVVMLLFLTTLSAIGQKDREQLNSGPDHDYLSELKEQLQLKWPENRTINIVFHGHSVPAGYFTGGLVNTLAAYLA